MAITIGALKATLDEMKKIYPFEDNSTQIGISENPLKDIMTVVEVTTVDTPTGVKVHLSKDAEWESIRANY